MRLIWIIAVRNVIRQKRRNALLGSAVASGTICLMLILSFSSGISDTIMNQVMSYVSGHINVSFSRTGTMVGVYQSIFPDRDFMIETIRTNVNGIAQVQEVIAMMAQVSGNGKSEIAFMAGADVSFYRDHMKPVDRRRVEGDFKMIAGLFEDLLDSTLEHPVLISQDKAKELNLVRKNIFRARFRNIRGQWETARLTVAGIFRPANVFMSTPIFLDVAVIRKLMGYGPNDVGQIHLLLERPHTATLNAQLLHRALAPKIAAIPGTLRFKGSSAAVTALGIANDPKTLKSIRGRLMVPTGCGKDVAQGNAVLVSSFLSDSLGIRIGDTCHLSYEAKFAGRDVDRSFIISALFQPDQFMPHSAMLINDFEFYSTLYGNWPPRPDATRFWMPSPENPYYPSLGKEWKVTPIPANTSELVKTYRDMTKSKSKVLPINVSTMYQTGNVVLRLEDALNLAGILASAAIFCFVLLGTISGLRVSIRERTREIGTMRSIGMHGYQVRRLFVLETALVAVASSFIGTVMALIAMKGLSLLPIPVESSPIGMILPGGHIAFRPSGAQAIFCNFAVVVLLVFTAYATSYRASKLPPSKALLHYD